MHVREGQEVKAGTVLAEFRSLELAKQEEEFKTQFVIHDDLANSIGRMISTSRDPRERDELKKRKLKEEVDRNDARLHLTELIQEAGKRLILRAPCNGVVMGLPKVDEIGKRWEKDQETPFCNVGDPTRLRVLVPVSADDYELIRDNLLRAKARNEQLPVTIRVHGRGLDTWQGHVTHLPPSEAKEANGPDQSRRRTAGHQTG
jgi:hypothetical protein